MIVGVLFWLSTGTASAQTVDDATRGAARTLGYDGVKAFQAGDFPVANEKLDKAYRVLKVPSLGLWSARALARVGKLVEASERYAEVLRLSPTGGDETVQKQAQADAQVELDELAPRVPSVVVELEGATPAETKVTIDGVVMAPELIGERRPTNPGHHTVVGVRDADEARAEVRLADGERKPIRLVFPARPAAAPPAPVPPSMDAPSAEDAGESGSTQRTLGWVSLAAGGVGFAVGAVFGALAMSTHSELEESGRCRGYECLESARDDVNALQAQRAVSTIGFIAGAAFAATGIVLVLTAPKSAETPGTALLVGPSGVRLVRAF